MGNSLGKKKTTTTEAKEAKSDSDSDGASESGKEPEITSDDEGDASAGDKEAKVTAYAYDASESSSSPGNVENVGITPEESSDQEETPSAPEESGPTVHAQAQGDEPTEKGPKSGSTEMKDSSKPSKKFSFPPNWMERCLKDSKWCDKLLKEALASHRTKALFDGGKRPKLSKAQEKEIAKKCSKFKAKKKASSCIKQARLKEQMKEYLIKRSGLLAGDFAGLSTAAWLGLFVGGLLLVVALILYFVVFTGKGAKKGASGRSRSSRFKIKSSKLKSKAGSGGKMTIKSRRAKSKASKVSKASK